MVFHKLCEEILFFENYICFVDYLIWAIIVTICCKVSVVIIIRLSIKIRYTRMHDIPMQLTDIDSPAPTTPPPAAPSAPPATTPPTASAPVTPTETPHTSTPATLKPLIGPSTPVSKNTRLQSKKKLLFQESQM